MQARSRSRLTLQDIITSYPSARGGMRSVKMQQIRTYVRSSVRRRGLLPQEKRWMSACRFLRDGSVRVDVDDPSAAVPPGPGEVSIALRAAPCTQADLRTIAAAKSHISPNLQPPSVPVPPHLKFAFPFVGGSEGLWEVTALGEGVSSFRRGDLAVPIVSGKPPGTSPESGTWRTSAIFAEASLVRVAGEGEGEGAGGRVEPTVLAHTSASVATALRVLEDFTPKALEAGDRVVFTGASTAVAQFLLQLAAARGLESVCLVSDDEEAERATKLGAWKVTLLKEFKAMRMDNACLVADGEGGLLGFTAARALRFRGFFVSYADVSGGGVSLPVAGQIFRDTRCRGFSLQRWASKRTPEEARALAARSLEAAAAADLRLECVQEFDLEEAESAIEAARAPSGGPVIFRGCNTRTRNA